MKVAYPYLEEWREQIYSVIAAEERQFARTLDAGVVQFEEALIPLTDAERVVGRRAEELSPDAPVLPGDVAFRLHDTYGFPIDLTVELAAEYGVRVDRAGFECALAEQRERSRGGREGRHGRPGRDAAALCPGRRERPATRGSWATRRPARRARSWRSCAMGSSTKRSRPRRKRSCARRLKPRQRSSLTRRRSTRRAAARSATRASSRRTMAPSSSRLRTRSDRCPG